MSLVKCQYDCHLQKNGNIFLSLAITVARNTGIIRPGVTRAQFLSQSLEAWEGWRVMRTRTEKSRVRVIVIVEASY